jgi:outer membrane lipoprotein-sorting protein
MRYLKGSIAAWIAAVALIAGAAAPAWGLTAQEIADSVIDELNNVSDYTASLEVDYDDEGINDMTDGCLQWKRNSGAWKTKNVDGSPYTCTWKCDGTVWNALDSSAPNDLYVMSKEAGDKYLRYRSAGDMFNMENILAAESWSKDANTETVNGVSCYRLYTSKSNTNYEVWIDEATATKVIRVKATDEDDDLHWRLDYSDYSDIEGTAELPATIVTTFYFGGDPELTVTYSFTDIDINEGLDDSIFECETSRE